MQPISDHRHQFSPEIIRRAVWLCLRFTLSYRDVEELLAERDLTVHLEHFERCRANGSAFYSLNSVSSALADLRSGVSKPSVNQSYTEARRSWASWRLSCCQSRARLVAARSSNVFAL
jgi:hypothetical protein